MPSRSLVHWTKERQGALDEVEAAHAALWRAGSGHRLATIQLNFAYALLLSSQFQGFCRDLHSEAVDHLVTHLEPPSLRLVVRHQLVLGRRLDAGNPNPGNLGADFARLGLALWPALARASSRAHRDHSRLERLNVWRNAIAHDDFDPLRLQGRATLGLAEVRRWRTTCNSLARAR